MLFFHIFSLSLIFLIALKNINNGIVCFILGICIYKVCPLPLFFVAIVILICFGDIHFRSGTDFISANQLHLLLFFVITLLFVTTITAQNQTGKYFTDENGVAIRGFDFVSYFTDYKAVKGSSDFSLNYDGAIFYFTSEDHKTMF